jgi:phage terminase large subunit-like protein
MGTPRPSFAARATQYAHNVVDGKVLASKWIRLACRRHLSDLDRTDSRWHYDAEKVEKVCRFIETLKLDADRYFRLQDFQVWIVASLMGWVDAEGLRKHVEALILIPKGNGKSPLAAALGLWFAFFDGKRKSEVYCGATSLSQALEVFKPAREFVESQPLFTRLGVTAQKKSIYSTKGDMFVPVIGRGKHGPKPYLAILDELHQAISPDLYDTFKTGCNKVVNSLLLTVSTAGDIAENNPCYQLQQQAQKMLEKSLENERLFAAIFCADDSVEWSSPEALQMANPNLGISNDAEKILLAQQEATRNPAKQGVFKAMHLDIWSNTKSAWMNMQAWAKCADPELTRDSVKDLPCWSGSDLASTLDLAATVLLFRKEAEKPHYYAFCRAYHPEDRVNAPENQHYQKWSKQGHLNASPGNSIDYASIEADALVDIATYKVQELAYDRRYADQWSQRVSEISGITRVETPPNPATLSPAMKELEAAVADGRFHHDGDPVLTWCMSNVLTRETAAGNYTMPEKDSPENKIDAAMALFIAMARAKLHTEPELKASDLFVFI